MTQVAIVGGGPVGLGLAIELGQRGIDVVLLERNEDLHRIPKGQNLTQRTAEHFRAWGVLDEIEAARPIPASFGTAGVTTYRNYLGTYSYEWLARSDVRAFYSERNIRIPQYEVERVLRARAAALPSVEIRYRHRVEDIVMAGGTPMVRVADREGGSYELQADYVVGCDGARSVVRERAGITQSLRSNRRRMILAVFRSEELDEILGRFPGKSYFNALHPDFGGYWQFLGRVDMQSWFFHAPVPEDSTLENVDLPARLAKAVGREIAFEQQYLGFWDLRIALADTYRAGGIFIAGDAAHSHPPYGGYGVNNGFEDVRNLGWKLEARLRGWGTEALLDSYTAERQPVFSSTADDFIARMIDDDRRFLETFDPERDRAAFEAEWGRRAVATKQDVEGYYPHYMGSPVVVGGGGRPGAVGAHSHTARAGCPLPPKDDVMDRLGPHFTLVSVGEPAPGDWAEQAAALGVPLAVAEMPETGETRLWGCRQIVVRPDRYVAFAGDRDAVPPGDALRVFVGSGEAGAADAERAPGRSAR